MYNNKPNYHRKKYLNKNKSSFSSITFRLWFFLFFFFVQPFSYKQSEKYMYLEYQTFTIRIFYIRYKYVDVPTYYMYQRLYFTQIVSCIRYFSI